MTFEATLGTARAASGGCGLSCAVARTSAAGSRTSPSPRPPLEQQVGLDADAVVADLEDQFDPFGAGDVAVF